MTGTQLLVLALLVAAFGAGWVAGRNGDERLELRLPRADLWQMLEEATSAARAALASRAAADLGRLEEAKQALTEALGAGHPLVDDLEQLGGALALATAQTCDADTAIASAVESAARTAANRFYRSAAAIRALEPDRQQRGSGVGVSRPEATQNLNGPRQQVDERSARKGQPSTVQGPRAKKRGDPPTQT